MSRFESTIRLGDIQFLNSWPVTWGLKAGSRRADISIRTGTPAQLNRRLLTGELDASAVSVMKFLEYQDEWVPVPGFCIRSDGPVASVLVVSREPLEQLGDQAIGISNQGATTPALLKILLAQKNLKPKLEVTPLRFPEILDQFPATLVIGDEALQVNQEIRAGLLGGKSGSLFVWDLGEVWSRWTQLPSVFALWVVRRSLVEQQPEVVQALGRTLSDSFRYSEVHKKQMIAQMRKTFPWETTFLQKYLKLLSYRLDAKALKGIDRFAKEAERIGELPKGTALKLQRGLKKVPGLRPGTFLEAEPAGAAR